MGFTKEREKKDSGKPDRDAQITEIYYTYKTLVLSIAYDILKKESLAEDILQETMLRVIQQYQKIRRMPPIEAKRYIARIAENCAIDEYRKVNRRANHEERLIENLISDNSELEKAEENYNNFKLLECVPPVYRVILYLKYCSGYSVREIAERMNLAENTVSYRLKKGKKILKEEWKKRKPV